MADAANAGGEQQAASADIDGDVPQSAQQEDAEQGALAFIFSFRSCFTH
jgi:hypothetical protein